ncbi:MAG: glycine--tRNA ligase subunit beta [Pseudomonadota bacterium]
MADFLLELLCEEIPARMQKGARGELEKLFKREMEAAGLSVENLRVWSTPRRLALIVFDDLPEATQAVREESKGPPIGAPDQAVDGFCRKNGVTRDALEVREVKGRETYFAVIEKLGRALPDVLAEAIPAIIRDFSWPKSMRWGEASISPESLKWVRPLTGILALFNTDIVECEIDGIVSGRTTMGHRFHSSGEIAIESAHTYASQLLDARVVVEHTKREGLIRLGAQEAAQAAGLKVVEDEGLVVENAGLTEWPVALLGRFDEAFLDVPPEVIQLTARVNQKYFVCTRARAQAGASGGGAGTQELANAFICTANIDAINPAVVVDGNRKVLAARLADARFFWELDQKKTLEEHAKGLERITFHEKLGTVADKVERVAKLARWLCEQHIVTPDLIRGPASSRTAEEERDPGSGAGVTKEELANLAEQAARLCKADLVTEMVGEFPELQGLMGGYYAEKEGLPREVSDAIRDHYKPVGQGDDVPTAPVTVAVSLADKLDTLVGFFAIDEKPTGSKDPFALRRAALAVTRLLDRNGLRLSLSTAHAELVEASHFFSKEKDGPSTSSGRSGEGDLLDFFADRLKVQQREAGVRHDLIDAVFALGGEDDLVRLLARVHTLQSFIETEEGANLLAGYKRAANILKKEGWEASGAKKPFSYRPEKDEEALIDALDAAEPKAAAAIEAEDFEGAMAALATLRAPIDRFFDNVVVNSASAEMRESRLDLLARFRHAVHQVADFSRIEG